MTKSRACLESKGIKVSIIYRAWIARKLTVSGEEGNGGTLGTRTTSSANTVNVVFRVVGVVIIQDMSNVTNIFRQTYVSKQSISGR